MCRNTSRYLFTNQRENPNTSTSRTNVNEVNEVSLVVGDCLQKLQEISKGSVDLIYMDPPFFTQKSHKLRTRDNSKEYTFEDSWESIGEYIEYLHSRLVECHKVLKSTGSIFLHCDKSASHYLRVLLDKVFGIDNFQSEIIWAYRRWSNSKKGLLNSHQVIYFYSKSSDFKFNTIFTDYSPTTNIDQILQERKRDIHGKSIYKRNENGEVVIGKEKKGVPLSDVWNIPYLNPKAKERTGYPTQKPVLLLEQIIKIVTDEGDLVLDPFCGSGTTLVASKLLNRHFIGIDKSSDAIELSQKRLNELVKSKSFLLEKGEQTYINKSELEAAVLKSIDAVPVQRNQGIDGLLKTSYMRKPIAVRIQKKNETLEEAKAKLTKAGKSKGCMLMILIRTGNIKQQTLEVASPDDTENLLLIDGYDIAINNWLKGFLNEPKLS